MHDVGDIRAKLMKKANLLILLFFSVEFQGLTFAATQVVSTHVQINAKNKVTLLYVFIGKKTCKHHSVLYSEKQIDIQHTCCIMSIVKTTLFLIVYRFSVLLFLSKKNNILPVSRGGGGVGGGGGGGHFSRIQ